MLLSPFLNSILKLVPLTRRRVLKLKTTILTWSLKRMTVSTLFHFYCTHLLNCGTYLLEDTVGSVQFHPFRPILLSTSGSRHFTEEPESDNELGVVDEESDEISQRRVKTRQRQPVTYDSSVKIWDLTRRWFITIYCLPNFDCMKGRDAYRTELTFLPLIVALNGVHFSFLCVEKSIDILALDGSYFLRSRNDSQPLFWSLTFEVFV